MSRNKFVVLIFLFVALYFVTPNSGVFATLKANVIMLLPYLLLGVIIYLIITINVLKRAWKRLDANVNDDNVINFAKIMNITFDVKRMLGSSNLIDLYRKVNFSTSVSMNAKQLLFEAMRRKRLDVPPPGKGTDIEKILNRSSNRTDEEIRAARIGSNAAAKKKKKKHKK